MSQPPSQDESTLDEPILDTLIRDLKAIGRKCLIIAFMGGENELRDWDLWGPLVLCIILAMILGGSAGDKQSGIVFAAVFILVWLGSAVVTLNAKFLGAKLSFFQIVCCLGYSIAPICVIALILLAVGKYWIAKMILCILAFVWSSSASFRFFKGTVKPERLALVVYPLGLFYFFMCWMLAVGI